MKTLIKHASKRTKLPILNHIRALKSRAMATDLDTFITCATNLPDGIYAAAMLGAGIVQPITEISMDNFPLPATLDGHFKTITLPVDDLAFLARAMSKEETRYYLQGIAVTHEGLVATDGHRLHMIRMGTGVGENQRDWLIIPRSAIDYAIKEKGNVTINLYRNGCEILAGEYSFITRYIDGTYPDYARVIPKGLEKETVFNALEFAKIAKDNGKMKKARGMRDDCKIRLDDTGKAKIMGLDISFPVSCRFDINIGFNVLFMRDVGFDGSLKYDASGNPILIEQGDKLAVVMPVRI